MKKEDETRIREFLGLAIGEASVCWDDPAGAGVFDSTKASKIVDRLFYLFEENIENAFSEGLKEAVIEVQGWRDLVIKVHKECPTTNPMEALREHNNQLSLLGVIESKLRGKAGENSESIFQDMKMREKLE